MKVLLAIPCGSGSTPIEFTTMLKTMWTPPSTAVTYLKRCRTDIARNKFAETAIKGGYDYLFMIDDDNPPTYDCLNKMLKADKDVICALVPKRVPGHEPCIFDEIKTDGKVTAYRHRLEFEDDVFEVDGIGTGVSLIKVDVLKKLTEVYGDPFDLEPVIHEGKKEVLSEDLVFSKRARECGFKLHCHGDVKIGHIGEHKFVEIHDNKGVTIKNG